MSICRYSLSILSFVSILFHFMSFYFILTLFSCSDNCTFILLLLLFLILFYFLFLSTCLFYVVSTFISNQSDNHLCSFSYVWYSQLYFINNSIVILISTFLLSFLFSIFIFIPILIFIVIVDFFVILF